MLTFEKAWTNENLNHSNYALWLLGADDAKNNWWIIAGVSRQFGLTNIYLVKIRELQQILDVIAADEYGGWASTEPSSAIDDIQQAYYRFEKSPWPSAYADKASVISGEYARFQRGINEPGEPEEHTRGMPLLSG